MTEANNPAYPVVPDDIQDFDNYFCGGMTGISKREYYAAKAMQGWLASYGPDAILDRGGEISVAKLAFNMADAMLAETERHNDLLALVERVAVITDEVITLPRIQELQRDARRILGRSE